MPKADLRQRRASPESPTSPNLKPEVKIHGPLIKPKSDFWFSASLIITFLSVFSRLWLISDPAEVVFDEVHFGKFASYYLERKYYFGFIF